MFPVFNVEDDKRRRLPDTVDSPRVCGMSHMVSLNILAKENLGAEYDDSVLDGTQYC